MQPPMGAAAVGIGCDEEGRRESKRGCGGSGWSSRGCGGRGGDKGGVSEGTEGMGEDHASMVGWLWVASWMAAAAGRSFGRNLARIIGVGGLPENLE
ncbi:hypothetical protein Tco_0622201 [Tanacetum coccineum]